MPAALEIVGDALYGLVKLALETARRVGEGLRLRFARGGLLRFRVLLDEAVDAAQKSLNAFDAGILPVEVAVGWGGEEAVKAGGVGAVAGDHFIGTDDVAEALRHFCAVFDHHALGEETLGGFIVGDEAEVAHEFCPEARVDEVKDGVFDAANVLVDGKPVLRGLGVEGCAVIMRVGVAVKVPGRIDEGVHGIGFAACGTSTFGADGVHEFGNARQR